MSVFEDVYKPKHKKGKGFLQDAYKFGKKALSKVVQKVVKPVAKKTLNVFSPVINKATSVVASVSNYLVPKRIPPSSQKFLDQFGDSLITQIRMRRKPVASGLNIAFTALTAGQWDETKQKLGYDNLYHLSIIINFTDRNGTPRVGMIEKLATLNLRLNEDDNTDAEYSPVMMSPPTLHIKESMDAVARLMGEKLYTYSAFHNNCQDFAYAWLVANKLENPTLMSFVVQPIDNLLKEQPGFVDSLSQTITNLGGIADRVVQGYGKANYRHLKPVLVGGVKLAKLDYKGMGIKKVGKSVMEL